MIDLTGPWALHMACVAIAAVVAALCLRRLTVLVPLSFLLGSNIAYALGNGSLQGSTYWSECFWKPIFRGELLSPHRGSILGLILVWLLPLATSLTVLLIVRRLRTAATRPRSKSGV